MFRGRVHAFVARASACQAIGGALDALRNSSERCAPKDVHRRRPPNASSVQLAHLHRIENVPDVTHHSFCELQRVAFRDGFSGTCHINGLHAAPLTKKQVPTEVLPSRVGM